LLPFSVAIDASKKIHAVGSATALPVRSSLE
jgi:hypothetical protein